jgi:micrococcal nuclease
LLVIIATILILCGQFTGRVLSVYDGDTITVLRGLDKVKVRMEGIDAPERGQPWFRESRDDVRAQVLDKPVVIRWEGRATKDRYGRIVGEVFHRGESLNASQVRHGNAWRYPAYDRDGSYQDEQDAARRERRGLWAGEKPVAPWEWRRRKKVLRGVHWRLTRN